MKRALLAASLLATLAAAAPARAAPEIVGVSTAAEGTKLSVTVETSLTSRGRVTVDGTVGGRRVRVRKGVKAGTRTTTVALDPRRARVRRAEAPIVFDVTATLTARGNRVERTAQGTVGVPVIVLPGFGNERTPGGFDAFAAALDDAADGAWGAGGKRPQVVVHEYDSAGTPLTALANELDLTARNLLRRSVFRRVDVVGYSMGGLVARQWMADTGGDRIRKLVFLGTPNEGAPVAYLASAALRTGALDALVANAAGGALTDVLTGFVGEGSLDALVNFYPTYPWAKLAPVPGLPATTVTTSDLELLLSFATGTSGPDERPLETLNDVPPPDGAEIHAFFYSSVLPEALGVSVGTVDVVDLTPVFGALLGGGAPDLSTVDLASFASGAGDGVVPAHSVRMDGVPAWAARIVDHDLGAGTHVTFQFDPQVAAGVADVLTK